MKWINFICLALLWTGVILLLKRDRWDLKRRVMFYLGLDDGSKKETKLKLFIGRLKSAAKKPALERELSESLAYIKNMVVLGRGETISAQLLMEELSEVTDVLSETYIEMSRFISMNESAKAAECLHNAVGESYAVDLGRFFAGWEEIPGEELLPSINAYQSSLREARETKQKRKDEIVSDLIYFPVVLNCMAVLMNFIYVGFYLPQREMLQILF